MGCGASSYKAKEKAVCEEGVSQLVPVEPPAEIQAPADAPATEDKLGEAAPAPAAEEKKEEAAPAPAAEAAPAPAAEEAPAPAAEEKKKEEAEANTAVLSACQQVAGYEDAAQSELEMKALAVGAQALSITCVKNKKRDPTRLSIVVRIHKKGPAPGSLSLQDVIGEAAANAGVGPRLYVDGRLPTGQFASVMEYFEGGLPKETFLAESKDLSRQWGGVMATFHSIPTQILAPFDDCFSISDAGVAMISKTFGLSEEVVAERRLGTFPMQMLTFWGCFGHSPATEAKDRALAEITARFITGAPNWVKSDAGGRFVLCHGDPHHKNIMLNAEGNLKLIDFETARVMPACFDLAVPLFVEAAWERAVEGGSLVGLQPTDTPYDHCLEIAREYLTRTVGSVDASLEDLVWDMEVGVVSRMLFILYILKMSELSDEAVEAYYDKLYAAIDILENSHSDKEKRASVAASSVLFYK